jgi:hypothetical protein
MFMTNHIQPRINFVRMGNFGSNKRSVPGANQDPSTPIAKKRKEDDPLLSKISNDESLCVYLLEKLAKKKLPKISQEASCKIQTEILSFVTLVASEKPQDFEEFFKSFYKTDGVPESVAIEVEMEDDSIPREMKFVQTPEKSKVVESDLELKEYWVVDSRTEERIQKIEKQRKENEKQNKENEKKCQYEAEESLIDRTLVFKSLSLEGKNSVLREE